MFRKKCNNLIEKYMNDLKNNQIFEIYKNGELVKHSILKVSGENYGKE